jgi:hypothetical protein
MYDFIEQYGVGAGFVYKSTTAGYYFDGVSTFTQIVDADYPATTTRGIVYLDGTYYVMTPGGAIYGSAINNPASWSALNVIQAQMEPDGGVCLAKQLNLLVAFGQYSTEFFYDAGNATGSPLSPYASGFLEIGCASAGSVVNTDNTLYFMGNSRQKGRGIYRFNGTSPEQVSNPYVDRILNADDLTTVQAIFVKLDGHAFYILYLSDSAKTLVYDATTGQWAEWTKTTASATKNITAASWADGLATVTATAHGFNDGDVATIASVNPSGYNATKVTINTVDANTFTYEVASNPGTYVSGGTALNYTEGPFAASAYTHAGNFDLIQDSTTGAIYAISTGLYEDNGTPIEFHIRTVKHDGGNNKMKFFSNLQLVGDKVDSTIYVRYTNDDYQSWSKFRPVDLNTSRSNINRLGQGRRRAFELRHHDNVPLRVEALEVDVKQGVR